MFSVGMVPLHKGISSQNRSGMARVVKELHGFTCHARVYIFTNEIITIHAFAFPAEAGPHFLAPAVWKTELA